MNRNHLALFHIVAEAGSISGGASAARISQPAVSKQIAELEHSLGVKLLERLPRGCRLTPAGEILADYARRWKNLEVDASRAIEEYRGLKRGRLSIGASLTVSGYFLPPILAEFHRLHPGVELQVRTENTRQIQSALTDSSIELGLTEGPLEAEELDFKLFFMDELVAIAPPNHPLLKRRNVTARELCREPLIAREEGSGTRAVVEHALARKGLKLQPLLSLASPEAIKNVVASGMGVAFVSQLVVNLEVASGRLAIVPVKDLRIRRPFYHQHLHGRSLSPAAARFLELLSSAAKHPAV